MSFTRLIREPIRHVKAQDRLPITARVWDTSHAQHRLHRQCHHLDVHRPGIFRGLDIVASEAVPGKIWITPGVAIDPEGNVLVNPTAASLTLDRGNEMIYVSARFSDYPDEVDLVRLDGDGGEFVPAFVVESCEFSWETEPPTGLSIELARIDRSKANAQVLDAADPDVPGLDELNLLHRRLAFPYCRVDGSLGELSVSPKKSGQPERPNRAGLIGLIRAGNEAGFHLNFVGDYDFLSIDDDPPLMLYLSGGGEFESFNPEEVFGLKKYLERGGMLFGDASGGDAGFVSSFKGLANSLGADLHALPKGHRLLAANSRFATPPIGAQETGQVSIDAAAGVILSTYDHGGAWKGTVEATKLLSPRARIKEAEEFGLNLIAYAARRARDVAYSPWRGS